MGSEQSSRCSGAYIDKNVRYQVGMMMVPLYAWHLGQWELGLKDPLDNIAEMNADEVQG